MYTGVYICNVSNYVQVS